MSVKHSRLGGSGAERWMECHGSVALLDHLGLPPSDEDTEWRIEGVAMHDCAAYCLINGCDAWERVGAKHGDPAIEITPAFADAVQVYLDYCRTLPGKAYVEYQISSPVHKEYFGQLDFGAVGLDPEDSRPMIHIVDFKGGAGIMVDVVENKQERYYAFGLIDGIERQEGTVFDDATRVVLAIVQPRGYLEPVRIWETTVGEIKAWVHNDLIPHMLATEYDDSLNAGDWCRFCPAKLVCPLLTAMFEAGAKANPKHVVELSDQAVFLNWGASRAVKHYIKALEADTLRRLLTGVDGGKHVHLERKKANRVWNGDQAEAARERFGDSAFTTPELKSPPQIEELPGGKPWVKQRAYKPDTGYTVAAGPPGPEGRIVPPKPGDRFAGYNPNVEEW